MSKTRVPEIDTIISPPPEGVMKYLFLTRDSRDKNDRIPVLVSASPINQGCSVVVGYDRRPIERINTKGEKVRSSILDTSRGSSAVGRETTATL